MASPMKSGVHLLLPFKSYTDCSHRVLSNLSSHMQINVETLAGSTANLEKEVLTSDIHF